MLVTELYSRALLSHFFTVVQRPVFPKTYQQMELPPIPQYKIFALPSVITMQLDNTAKLIQ